MTTHASSTPKGKTDVWQTPPEQFGQLHAEFGFVVDVAADHYNALLPFYFTEEMDGLSQTWPPAACWCNPPYSGPLPWIEKAASASQGGSTVVMLLNFDPSVRWFRELWRHAAEVRMIFGRLAFFNPFANTRSGNNKPQFVAVFRPGQSGPPRVRYVSRDDLTKDI